MKLTWLRATLALVLGNALSSYQTYQDVNKAIIFKWKTPEFEYPSEEARNEAIERKRFVPTNALILDGDYYAPAGRYFVTLPLFRTGVPASLAEVIGQQAILRPFPRWLKYNETSHTLSCNGPHSVFRIYIDKCGLMWALDSGLSSAANFDFSKKCPPKLLVYDLNNGDREILRYVFPESDFVERSNPTTFAVESYQKDCSDSFVYIADEIGHGLIVFDYAQKSSWRTEDPSFYPHPKHHFFSVNGVGYSIMAGIFGLTLGPIESDRKLYFHAFSSVTESWMPVAVLKNRMTALTDRIRGPTVVTSPGERAGQSTVEVMTDDGILIYHLLPMNAIVCWNSQTPFTSENQHVLERDDENFQYISGMKLKDNNLFITSCRYQNFLYLQENATDYNYRFIVIEDVKRLIANTPCANAPTFVGNAGGLENNNYLASSSGAAYPNLGSVNTQDASNAFENTNYIASRFGASSSAGSANSQPSSDVGAGFENSEYGAYPIVGEVSPQQAFSDENAGFKKYNYISSRFSVSPKVGGHQAYSGHDGGPNSVLSDAPYQSAGYPRSDSSYYFPYVEPYKQYSNGGWSIRGR